MDKDKSILERFTDTVKDIANSASEALKAEEPPKVAETNAAYMPFAAEGLVSDPLLVPPVGALPPRKKRTKPVAKAVVAPPPPKIAGDPPASEDEFVEDNFGGKASVRSRPIDEE